MLNPGNEHFCIGGDRSQVQIPIQINQTSPNLIELLRRDLDSAYNETLTIKASEAKKLRAAAIDLHKRTKGPPQANDALLLQYTVKKPGQYTIQKIVDVSKLEVNPRQSEVVVVSCPSARVKTEDSNRCKGDLSDISFEVEGTPPLKIKYRKLVNGNPTEASFQSIQPSDFVSAVSKGQRKGAAKTFDVSWARSRLTRVSINETMMALGDYSYAIDEVQDALGNKVTYNQPNQDHYYGSGKPPAGVRETITVRDRPFLWIPSDAGCNAEQPLKVAQGREVHFPHKIGSVGQTDRELHWEHRGGYQFREDHYVEYEFTPESELKERGQPKTVKTRKSSLTSPIVIKNPGLYVLTKVWTDHCAGEVSASSSCLLQNPLKPEVKISSAEISDKCADSPIGLRVNFEFTGSPPFTIKYREEKSGERNSKLRSAEFPGHRGQLELVPVNEGHYKYTFSELKDDYYAYVPVNEALSQDVRPAASAYLTADKKVDICLGESPHFSVQLIGEPPWKLEYEVIHGKSRQKFSQDNITESPYRVSLPPQKAGGEYSVSLASVSDKSGCKEFPKSEAKFQVWSQTPTAAFGLVNGKRTAQILEGSVLRLPLRFNGQPGFDYKITHEETGVSTHEFADHVNDVFQVARAGTYVISDVSDLHCKGVADSTADRFSISWISRPSLGISQHPSISPEGDKHAKKDVCEGEDDFMEVSLQGISASTFLAGLTKQARRHLMWHMKNTRDWTMARSCFVGVSSTPPKALLRSSWTPQSPGNMNTGLGRSPTRIIGRIQKRRKTPTSW
jgi:nucleoporin POM152